MHAPKKNVIVMGKGSLAVKVADWFQASNAFEVVCVVPNNPRSEWAPTLNEWAERNNVCAIESGLLADASTYVDEQGISIDLAVSVTYDKIVKPEFIERCGKIINIHNGPLPKYRGVNPINWALKNGEISHGVTVHEITPGIDDGPIVSQVIFPISPQFDEVIDVYERSLNYGWQAFKAAMTAFPDWRAVQQDHGQASYYSKADFPSLGERSGFTRPNI